MSDITNGDPIRHDPVSLAAVIENKRLGSQAVS
jgi:hypothetical protein